ncbi:MAG TPA: hypothetical protein VI934_01470 [Candidatus Nanoarchaeia archaeon]|nr:hypothetical protein [Candidatus Nanoarchaeia archaeon]
MPSKTLFLKVFGDTPVLRVMDFLVVNEDFDYSMTDIAKHARVGYSTLKLFWENLERSEIVVNTRNVGKAKMYRLNFANTAVKKFRGFYWETTKRQLRASLRKKVAVDIIS